MRSKPEILPIPVFGQWRRIRDHAASKGVRIIGDIPIFVALDSADVWQNQSYFQIDLKTSDPIAVAGCPPDYLCTLKLLTIGRMRMTAIPGGSNVLKLALKCTMSCVSTTLEDSIRIGASHTDPNAREGEWVDGSGTALQEGERKFQIAN